MFVLRIHRANFFSFLQDVVISCWQDVVQKGKDSSVLSSMYFKIYKVMYDLGSEKYSRAYRIGN
jgi:hypothetical protein